MTPKKPTYPKKMRRTSYTTEGSQQEIRLNLTYLATDLYNYFRALPQPVHVNLRTISSNTSRPRVFKLWSRLLNIHDNHPTLILPALDKKPLYTENNLTANPVLPAIE
jgi:hypothetical protein